MKKEVVGYMAIGMLAMAVMVQAQPATRPGRSFKPGDSTERRMEPSRGMRQMPQNRGGLAPFGGQSMQRGGTFSTPGNRGMQRGGMAPGFGLGQRNGQQGLQRGIRPGMQQGLQRGMRKGFQQAPSANPEVRIKREVDQLKKSLDLTDDQVKKITGIKEKQAKKEIKAYKKAQKKAADRRKKLQAPNEKIKSVLTEEQVKKFESSRSRVGSGTGVGTGFGGSRLGGNRFQR